MELAGPNAVATLPDDPWAEQGFNFLERQTSGIGGGTTEMARNNISERVLGMPREQTRDKNIPFRDVPKGPSSTGLSSRTAPNALNGGRRTGPLRSALRRGVSAGGRRGGRRDDLRCCSRTAR